jgi:hypothetical protein
MMVLASGYSSLLDNHILVDSGFRRNDEKKASARESSFRRKPESSVLTEFYVFQQAYRTRGEQHAV